MPEPLAEVHIEYPTGLRVVPGCAQDIVAVAVPGGAALPTKPGCGFPESLQSLDTLLERAQQLLRQLVH